MAEATAELESARGHKTEEVGEELLVTRRADDAETALAKETAQRRRLEQELLELRAQPRRPSQATLPDLRLTGEAESAIGVIRRLVIGRAAGPCGAVPPRSTPWRQEYALSPTGAPPRSEGVSVPRRPAAPS